MTIGVWAAGLGVCADAWLVANAIEPKVTQDIAKDFIRDIAKKIREGIAPKIEPENIEKKLRMNAKIGLSAVTSPGGEGFVEVVESEEMQDDGEFQSQNIPRPFSNHKGVVGRGFLTQIHVVSAGEVVGAANDGNGELGVQEDLPPGTRSGRVAQSHRRVNGVQDDDSVRNAVFNMVVQG